MNLISSAKWIFGQVESPLSNDLCRRVRQRPDNFSLITPQDCNNRKLLPVSGENASIFSRRFS